MQRLTHKTILYVYLGLLSALGVMAVFSSTTGTMPRPGSEDSEKWQRALADEGTAAQYMTELGAIRDRQERLADITIGGFSTVLGAIIGFLSASWAGLSSSAQGGQRSEQVQSTKDATSED